MFVYLQYYSYSITHFVVGATANPFCRLLVRNGDLVDCYSNVDDVNLVLVQLQCEFVQLNLKTLF